MTPLRPGDPPRLGRYELMGRLGEGGQGIVYLGRDPAGRSVAVKLLRVELAGDRARFARELAAIERVAGFCTAQVIDADVVADQPYIVSEYVPGPSLQQYVAEKGTCAGTGLDRLAIGTATALAAIHQAGIVHRDFKPANVLMGPDGPRVIDFGIARVLEGTDSAPASVVIGTPAYMAPEQIAGGQIAAATDVFAWASMMVFAATGDAPYRGDSIPAIINQITNGAPDLTAVPPTLRPLLARCLAKEPAARPTARELLLTLIGEEHDRARPLRQLPATLALPRHVQTGAAAPIARRNWLSAVPIAACAALLAVAGAAAWMYIGTHRSRCPSLPPASGWRLTDGTGTSASAWSGAKSVTLTGGATWANDSMRGTVVSFNGSSGQAATTGPVLTTTDSFTVSAWAKFTGGPGNQTVVAQDATTTSSFYLGLNNIQFGTTPRFSGPTWAFAVPIADSASTDWNTAFDTSGVTVGQWSHLTGVYDGVAHTAKLYVNGIVQSTAQNVTVFASSGAFTIGRAKWAGQPHDFFDGDISDVRSYAKALTDPEVKSLACR